MSESPIHNKHKQAVLLAAMAEVKDIFKRYDIGGLCVMGNDKGGEYQLMLPSWSVMSIEAKGNVRFKFDKNQAEEAVATIDFLLGTRDICANFVLFADQCEQALKPSIEIEHKVIKPEDMGIVRDIN